MAATVVEKAFCVLELAKMNSVTLVQRYFRRRYGKPPPTRQSIYDWSKKFQESGFLCKGKSSGRPPIKVSISFIVTQYKRRNYIVHF